jgi:hypothetical protein
MAMPKQIEDLDLVKRKLQDDLDRAQTAEIALVAERDGQSFPALVLKEKRAVDRLAAVNAELAALTASASSIRAAIAETDRRIAERDKATAAEAQCKRAETAWPIAERLVEHGRKMDEALAAYLTARVALEEDLALLTRLGCPTPSRALVGVNLRNAHDGVFADLDLHSRPVPPNRRHSFATLTDGWALPARKWLAGRLNKSAPASPEAPVKDNTPLEAELAALRKQWMEIDTDRREGVRPKPLEQDRLVARIRGIERELKIEPQSLGTPVRAQGRK